MFCNSTKHSTTVTTKTINTGDVVIKGRYCLLLPGHTLSGNTSWCSRHLNENMLAESRVEALEICFEGAASTCLTRRTHWHSMK
jgi:hypothetical protein